MRLTENQIKKLTQVIFKTLKEKKLAHFKIPELQLKETIEKTIFDNFKEETKLEEDVQKIMDQYQAQIKSGQLNERELFLKMKKEMAKKRNFVL